MNERKMKYIYLTQFYGLLIMCYGIRNREDRIYKYRTIVKITGKMKVL